MSITDSVREQARQYGRPDRALGGYAAAMGVFAAGALGLAGVAWRTGRRPPAVSVSDFLQLGYAAAQQRTEPPESRGSGT